MDLIKGLYWFFHDTWKGTGIRRIKAEVANGNGLLKCFVEHPMNIANRLR